MLEMIVQHAQQQQFLDDLLYAVDYEGSSALHLAAMNPVRHRVILVITMLRSMSQLPFQPSLLVV